jgi:hypothetical protein
MGPLPLSGTFHLPASQGKSTPNSQWFCIYISLGQDTQSNLCASQASVSPAEEGAGVLLWISRCAAPGAGPGDSQPLEDPALCGSVNSEELGWGPHRGAVIQKGRSVGCGTLRHTDSLSLSVCLSHHHSQSHTNAHGHTQSLRGTEAKIRESLELIEKYCMLD